MNKKTISGMACIIIAVSTLISSIVGFTGGYLGSRLATNPAQNMRDLLTQNVRIVDEESAIVSVAENASPSVVSIVITQDVPIYENYRYNPFGDDFSIPGRRQVGTEERQVGAGTGFIVSQDGLIITNRHVVSREDASYTVIFSDGRKFSATILARDTLLDIAFLDIEGNNHIPLKLGSSKNLKVGQRVIAIGNALGEFSNTVSTGIISGLSRNIVAGSRGRGNLEQLNDVIQTDASINLGNSGGPLLDVEGNVIGVNVAVARNAENIGFAIPIDVVRDLLERLESDGNINRPILGVRYVLVTDEVQRERNLSVNYGALVTRGSNNEPAVLQGSPASNAGIVENDIILEINGTRIDSNNLLQNVIQSYRIGDQVKVKILRDGSERELSVRLNQAQN